MATICKSWEKQVLENTNKIKELEERAPGGGSSDVTRYEFNALSSRVTTAEGEIGQLEDDLVLVDNAAKTALSMTQNVAERALKTPLQAPASTQLVAVTTGNDQQMINIGSGLSLSNNTLSASGGSGKYLHVIKFKAYHEFYLTTAQYGQVILLLNTSTNFTGTSVDTSPTYEQFEALGNAMSDVGYHSVSVLVHEDNYSGTFTSLSFRSDIAASNLLVVDTSDGETLGNDSFYEFNDTVIPV